MSSLELAHDCASGQHGTTHPALEVSELQIVVCFNKVLGRVLRQLHLETPSQGRM